jgi:hypothetical protein
MNLNVNGESAEVRERMLKLALMKSKSQKVKFPTVAMPTNGFKRKRLVSY